MLHSVSYKTFPDAIVARGKLVHAGN